MSSAYQLIFRLAFEHAFFADGKLRALRIVPVAACFDMLRRAGLLLRNQDDGIAAFGDAKAVERLRLHLAEGGGSLGMAFQVFFTDRHFFEYTVPARPAGQLLFLDTADATPDAQGRLMLHVTPCVPQSAFLARDDERMQAILGKRILPPEPAMVLQVALTPGILDAAEVRERCFHVRFDAASSHWKYCLFRTDEAQVGIVDLAGEMEFDHCADVDIADGRRADVFLSKRAIPMREVAEVRFQLRAASAAGDKVLIKRMPNASVGRRFRHSRDGSEILVSELFVNTESSNSN